MPMRRILVINPNSSEKMTRDIRETLSKENLPAQIEVICMKKAPPVLESFTDYTLAGAEVIEYFTEQDMTRYDGILLACFGDPCLYSLKEISPVPVLGIAEAAFSRALLLGYKFSVLAASSKALPMMESMIDTYGLQARNAGSMTLNTPIEEFLSDAEQLEGKLLKVIQGAKEKQAEVVIYGCAGMTMVSKKKIMEQTQVSVIDPVITGVSTLLSLLSDGDSVSGAGLYAKHQPKRTECEAINIKPHKEEKR